MKRMNPENFAYWLQGYLEIAAPAGESVPDLTSEQVQCIKDHLALVFRKETPERAAKPKKAKQEGAPYTLAADIFTRPDVTCSVPVTPNVTPPADPNQIRINIQEEVRKRETRREDFLSPTRWVGGGRGQKYC